MKYIIFLYSIVASQLALGNLPLTQDPPSDIPMNGWEFVHSKKQVNVYRRESSNSDVIAVRGIAVLPYSVEIIYNVLQDNERAHEWIPMITKKETVSKITPFVRIEYAKVQMPWPLQNRYTVAKASLNILPNKIHDISYKSVPGYKDDSDRIRVHLEESRFYLKPIDATTTQMDIMLLSDPMGTVPKFLVNAFQKNWPVKFLDGLKQQITKIQQENIKLNSGAEGSDMSH